MAVLQWVIVCERAITEDQAKTVSLISILENITLPPPPPELLQQGQQAVVPLRFYVVQLWSRSNVKMGERVPGRVLLSGPNGQQFGASEFVVDLTGSPRARIISQTIGFPLLGPGTYKCIVQSQMKTKWRKVGETEFGVIFTDNASPRPKALRRH
jgi:hypothetical protein